jgi:hypothetical protein
MRAVISVAALAFTAVAASRPASPLAVPEPFERIAILSSDVPLGRVTAAEFHGATAFVVTAEPAAIFRAEGTRLRRWGATGPLQSPADALWAGERLLVRDARRQSLDSFGPDGRLLASRALPGPIASWAGVVGGDTLVSLLEFRNDSATIVRLRGTASDTLLRFAMPHPVRLMARGSPTYSVIPPFAPTPAWAALPGGRLAFWDGRSGSIALLDVRGRPAGRLPLPRGRYPVAAADREWWLHDAIPREFMGQRVFEPLRARARAEVAFPGSMPAALALLPDPARGVWIRRTPASSGEVWAWVDAGGVRAQVRMPAGRELLAVGAQMLAVRGPGTGGRHVVELYRKPSPAARGNRTRS